MAAHLFNRFRKGAVFGLLKAAWLNALADMWNHARGGHCINFTCPPEPSLQAGPKWDLDVSALDGELVQRGFAKDVADGTTPVHIDAAITNHPTPDEAYNAGEGGASVPANQSNTWDRATATAGVKIDVFSRQIERANGNAEHWCKRTWTFDKQGRLERIDVETFGAATMGGIS